MSQYPTRTVTYKLDGPLAHWAGSPLRFRLTWATYTSEVQIPTHDVLGETDTEGEGEVDLFPNELGSVDSEWEVRFPDGTTRRVRVPDGEGPVNLSALLEEAL